MSIRPIFSELQELAEKELNEVPRKIEGDIKHIREWIAQQPHLHSRTDDQWLLNFLRNCKFSLQRTKEKLDLFYTMRGLLPQYFSNRDPFQPEIQEVLTLGLILPLPKTVGNSGPRIILARYGKLDGKIPLPFLFKTLFMIVDILLNEDDNFIIAGQHVFADFKGTSLEYLLGYTLNDYKNFVECCERAYPSRPQLFDFTNMPGILEALLNTVKGFCSEKIRERIHIYTAKNSEMIYKRTPRSYFPKEYGGDGDSIDDLAVYWKKKVESYKDWFLKDAQYCVDETKRIGKSKYSPETFCVEGSFRKLEFD